MTASVFGQDAHFSQVISNSQYQNPGQIMDQSLYPNRKAFVSLQYRDQWRSIANPSFRTIMLEGQINLYKSSIDGWYLGFLLLDDQSNNGIYSNSALGLSLSYSRKLSINRSSYHQVSFGSSIRYHRTNLNNAKLWFGRQYDIANLEVNTDISSGEMNLLSQNGFLSIGIGSTWSYHFEKGSNISASLGLMHLNKPTIGMFMTDDEILNSRATGQLAFIKKTGRYLYQGAFTQLIMQAPWQQLIGGYQMKYSLENEVNLNASLAARMTKSSTATQIESLILGFGLEAKTWKAQLSYDMNLSSLSNQGNNARAFELKLEYYFLDN